MNVRRLLYFAKDGNDVREPAAFRKQYGFDPDGVNFYYGLNAAGAEHHRRHGAALRENHRTFFEMVKRALLLGERKEFLVNLGLWPFEPGDPYGWVADHLPLVQRLAEELHGYQTEAEQRGKRLEIVVRYASEMNDPMKAGQPWGRPFGAWDPMHARPYRETLAQVRAVFRAAAPAVRFTFSPALRADITGARYAMIRDFWPGKEAVDAISCTWYAGQAAHVEGAVAVLQRYLDEFGTLGLPFGVDEVGGINGQAGNDEVLAKMFQALNQLAMRRPPQEVDYVTLFLQSKWAVDATLRFLSAE